MDPAEGLTYPICDDLDRETMNLMKIDAAGRTPPIAAWPATPPRRSPGPPQPGQPAEAGPPAVVHQQLAQGVLMAVPTIGQQPKIAPDDWPGTLPVAVLAAVRQTPR